MSDAARRPPLFGGHPVTGIFSRFADPDVAELLAAAPIDFIVLDAEHGSFDRQQISRFVGTCASRQMPVILRIPGTADADIQHAVTVGATGLILPHIDSAQAAGRAAQFARTLALQRAYAGMGRVANYRREKWLSFYERAGKDLLVIAQIDEPAGVANVHEIAALDGIDALFMGRLGMTLAMGESEPASPAVDQALASICSAGRLRGKPLGMFLPDIKDAALWRSRGVSLFVVGSDYSILLDGVSKLSTDFRRALDAPAGRTQ